MLQFIVLGTIPGTYIQISFFDMLRLTASLFLAYEVIRLCFKFSRRPKTIIITRRMLEFMISEYLY